MNRPPFHGSVGYPDAVDSAMVGRYPALVKSGGGYFYDEVLEYRVWVHPKAGGEAPRDGEDYFFAFATYEEARACSATTEGAEAPLVLVRQLEHVNEPSPGQFEHVKGERLTEWRVEWLEHNKRGEDSIQEFLRKRSEEV